MGVYGNRETPKQWVWSISTVAGVFLGGLPTLNLPKHTDGQAPKSIVGKGPAAWAETTDHGRLKAYGASHAWGEYVLGEVTPDIRLFDTGHPLQIDR